MDERKVYLFPAEHARQNGELNLYRESNRLNRECAADIDLGIQKRPDSNHLPPELAEKLIAQYGLERVNQVLANTVQIKEWDGRFSRENKDWANAFPRLEKGRDCVADAHPVFVDGFITQVRKQTAEREQAGPPLEKVGSYAITRAILFSNDRGFAYGECPGAVQPFATWQYTHENGKKDAYWGHYHAKQDDALTDYQNRVNEYMADHPDLHVVVNPLAAAEMTVEANYNMIDGLINNLPTPKADLTDGQTYEEIKELAPETLPQGGRKFENVDVIASLAAVVERNTQGYKTDFNYDREAFIHAAESPDPADRTFLWLSRLNGTECFLERNAFIRNTEAFGNLTYYESQSSQIKAFAVEITGMSDGKVMGSLFELDYPKQVRQMKREAMDSESVSLTFKDGAQKGFSYEEYSGHFQRIQDTHGRVSSVRHEVKDESALQSVLKQQHDARHRFPARSFDAYIKKLDASARQQEKPSVTERLKEAKQAVQPPSPGKSSPSKSEPAL